MPNQASNAKISKSTQNSLLISEIKDGIVIMRDGSIRGVIKSSAINFDLMSAAEQNAVEFAFQGFVNSLHFPVQISIKSQKIDLDPYIEKLDARRAEQANELLAGLMEDYILNIKALVDEVNIMDKQFYIVVPYFPPLNIKAGNRVSLIAGLRASFEATPVINVTEEQFKQYQSELNNRMALVSSGLTQMGVQAKVLGTQELIDLYYTWYNPDVAGNQKLIDASQLGTPVVTKGDGAAPRGPLPGAPL